MAFVLAMDFGEVLTAKDIINMSIFMSCHVESMSATLTVTCMTLTCGFQPQHTTLIYPQ